MRKQCRRRVRAPINTLWMLSPVPQDAVQRNLLDFYTALEAVTRGSAPTVSEWRSLSDVVNWIDVLSQRHGVVVPRWVLDDATQGMVEASIRFKSGKTMRLDGKTIEALRACIEVYSEVLKTRTGGQMQAAKRDVERMIQTVRCDINRATVVAL